MASHPLLDDRPPLTGDSRSQRPLRRNANRSMRRSQVSLSRQVDIGLNEVAPRGHLPSLDFDRVVNSYSIEATKKRLVIHHKLLASKGEKTYENYKTFQEDLEKGPVEEKKSKLLIMPYGKSVMTWTLTLLTGLVCGLVAILILFGVENIVSRRSEVLNRQIQFISGETTEEEMYAYYKPGYLKPYADAFARKFGFLGVFCEIVILNMLLALLSAAMCVFWAQKAIGSGIPEVKAYLNGVRVPSFAVMSTFVTKIVGTILSVSSGLIVGPEGPLVHVGAIIGQGITKTKGLDVALRGIQKRHPKLSGWFGCSKTDVFGEKQLRESSIWFKPLVSLKESRSREELALLRDSDDEEQDDDMAGPLPQLAGGLRRSGEGIGRRRDDDEPTLVNRGSLFLPTPLPQPRGVPDRDVTRIASTRRRKRCSPHLSFFSSMVSSLSTFRNDLDRRDLISIGVATGFAAAFGAPVGGLLYSIEEASSFYSIALMWRTLAATALGTFIIAMYHGDLSKFSVLSLGTVQASVGDSTVFSRFEEVPFYVLMGVGGGLLGAFFNACYVVASGWRSKFYGRFQDGSFQFNFYKLAEVAIVSIVTTSVTFLLPFLLPTSWTCTDAEGDEDEGFDSRFNCPPGQFNEIASIMLGSRDEALNDILTDPSKFQAKTLLLAGVVALFLMVITFGVALPSGLFMPTLMTGSSFGGYAGLMIQKYYLPGIAPGHMALLFATSMLGGVQRTTVSLCVIMLEATGQVKVLIPLIISVLIARYVADFFNHGYYHIIMHEKHYPFLEHVIKQSFDIPPVGNVMSSPVVTIRDIETAGIIEILLRENDCSSFPVVDTTTNEYLGLIRRDQLVALLECGIFVDPTDFSRSKTAQVREAMREADQQLSSRAVIGDDDIYSHQPPTPKKKKKKKALKLDNEHSWLEDNVLHTRSNTLLIGSDEGMPGATVPIAGATQKTVVAYDDFENLIVELSEDDRNKMVDIESAMNRGAYSVTKNTPLSKAYELFTALGLRTLPVVGKKGTVVGVLTRSNFQTEYMESRTGLQMQ